MKTMHKTLAGLRRKLWLAGLACGLLAAMPQGRAAFNAGSDGSDGVLDLSSVSSGTVVVYDPSAQSPADDANEDNVFNFTTINIPAGRTLRLLANKLNWAPVEFLASGAVTINGTIDLSGTDGTTVAEGQQQQNSIPGPGGFPGGTGATTQVGGGGGWGPDGGYVSTPGGGGGFSSNTYLMPLIGGSGGGGANEYQGSGPGGGGGAGGGAILIASNVSITINGQILANGGTGSLAFNPNIYTMGGSGGGGGIRLMAPTVAGNGLISCAGGPRPWQGTSGGYGANGRIRIEANTQSYTGGFVGEFRRVSLPPNAITNAGQGPRLRITTINGVATPANPSNSIALPDIVLSQGGNVNFVVQASNIPVGKQVTLYLYNETTYLQASSPSALTGTLASSTATISMTIPAGYTQAWVRASW